MRTSAIIAAALGVLGIAAVGVLQTCPNSQDAGFVPGHWPWNAPIDVGGANDTAVQKMIAHVNRRVGCEVLRWYDGAHPDIVVVDAGEDVGDPTTGRTREAERAYLVFDPTAQRSPVGRIELRNVITPNERYLAIGHGICHVLGLAHDRATSSMCHRYTIEYANAFPMPGLSDQDADILRAEHCR